MSFIDNKFRPTPKPLAPKTAQPTQPAARPATNTVKPAATPRADTFESPRKSGPVELNPSTARASLANESTPTAATTTATAAAMTPEAQARQDAARVEQAYARGGSREAAKELESLVAAHPNDPAYADALLRESQPTLDKIATELGDRVRHNRDDSGDNKVTRDTLTSLGKVAEAAGADGRARLGNTLAAGLPDQTDLNQFDDVLSDLAKEGQAHALSGAILASVASTKPQAAKELSELAVNQVNEARETYADAAQARDEMEARLAEDLAQYGGALTPEQVEAYKAEFRAKHKDVYDAERAASDALASTLEANRPAMEKLATQGNEDAAKALYEGYNELARSATHADDAIRWVSDLTQKPAADNALFRAIDEATSGKLDEKLENELLATAVPNAQAEILGGDYPGTPEEGALAAFEDLKKLMEPLKAAKALSKVPGQVGEFLEATKTAVVDRNFDKVGQNLLGKWDEKSAFGKALAVAAVAQSAYGAVDAFKDGNYPNAIKNSAAFASGALELTAGVLKTLGNASGLAADAAKFAARAAPVLGLVVDGVQFAQDVHGIFDDPKNAGKWIQALGTTISLVGDVAGAVPILGTAADLLLGTIGAGIHAIGGFVSNVITGNREKEELRSEQTELLRKVTGLSEDQVHELIDAGAKDIERLRGLGLTPEQLQRLAKDDSIDLTSMETAVLLKNAAAFGLRGQDVIDLLRAGQDSDELEYVMVVNINSPEAVRGAAQGDLSAYQENLLRSLEASGEQGRKVAEILRRGSGKTDFDVWGPAYDVLEGDGRIVSSA